MSTLLDWVKKLLTPAPAHDKTGAGLVMKEETQKDFPGILAARVKKVEKHPNADRLKVVSLDIGGNIVEPVVCGASNFQVGDMVALALPGAEISQNIYTDSHEPFVLQKAKIRGVESQGMICAAFELGLSREPGEGIALLKTSVKPGSKFSPEMIE